MFNKTKYRYAIKSCPAGDTEVLENLLNSMAQDGWEVYTMQEVPSEDEDESTYNCIFVQEYSPEEISEETLDILGFKSKMERIMSPQLEPYDQCIDIQKKIQDKKLKIAQVKLLLDSTSEDSRTMLNEEMSRNMKELEELKIKLLQVLSPEIMQKKLGEIRLSISLSEELSEILNPDYTHNLIAQVVAIRQKLTEKLGYIIPKVIVNIDETMQANEFSINIRGIPVVKSFAYLGFTQFDEKELNLEKEPKNSIKDIDFITGKDIIWIEEETAKDYWVKGHNATQFIGRMLEYVSVFHIDEIFDYSDVNRYIDVVGKQNLYLIENIIPDFVSVAELKYLLTSLIKEQVSIKDINYIFEKINDFSDDASKEELLSKMRVALSRQISQSLADEEGVIKLIEISEDTLNDLINKSDEDNVIKIDSSKIEALADDIKKAAEKANVNSSEIVIMTTSEVRHIMYLLLSQLIPNLRVVAKEEMLYEYPLEILESI